MFGLGKSELTILLIPIIIVVVAVFYSFKRKGVNAMQSENSVQTENGSRVIVTDITMPFGSMVSFMVKWAIASIPAFIILAILIIILGSVIAGMFGGILGMMFR